ncbi:MAG: hypothetical protein FWD58_07050 [Firmicutes bacterium]|nr:hypothetical protein [Bacillota bacterium]
MSKTFLFKLLLGLSILAAAVLWLLSVIPASQAMLEEAGIKNGDIGSWAALFVSGGWAVAFILLGIFSKDKTNILKKWYVYFGVALGVVAVVMLINIFAWEVPMLPVIAVAVALALLLGMIVVGGKKWDQGDNQNAGYKNYHQRKAEEEKKNKE